MLMLVYTINSQLGFQEQEKNKNKRSGSMLAIDFQFILFFQKWFINKKIQKNENLRGICLICGGFF